MKIAVLIIGSHYTGKTRTINDFLKPMLRIKRKRISKFNLNGREGRIWSQSLEEAKRSIDLFIHICIQYELIVVPCRPANEKLSYLVKVEQRLRKQGFIVHRVQIVKSTNLYYKNKAKEIYNYLK
jgi:hypothetical protein